MSIISHASRGAKSSVHETAREDFNYCVPAYIKWLEGASESVLWRSQLPNGVNHFPGGSRERVTKAGGAVRAGTMAIDDLAVINVWRAAHRRVINSFQAILRSRTRGTGVLVAQRHKRRRTIFDKLNRYPKMQLGRMDDVAGCRLIFADIDQLRVFRDEIHKAKFNHKLKNHKDKYDYIVGPKKTGYRGIHDVYSYDVRSNAGRHLKGLLIELQYRTTFQHAWATANELIGALTESQPKFERGDLRYQRIMCLASEIIARSFESMNASLPDATDEEVVREFVELDGQVNLMTMLRGLNVADKYIESRKNSIFIFGENGELTIQTFDSAAEALRALFELESKEGVEDIVLVRGDTPEEVRESFKNYFSDARHFVELIDQGCNKLLPSTVI